MLSRGAPRDHRSKQSLAIRIVTSLARGGEGRAGGEGLRAELGQRGKTAIGERRRGELVGELVERGAPHGESPLPVPHRVAQEVVESAATASEHDRRLDDIELPEPSLRGPPASTCPTGDDECAGVRGHRQAALLFEGLESATVTRSR